jgi:hypothetical protein
MGGILAPQPCLLSIAAADLTARPISGQSPATSDGRRQGSDIILGMKKVGGMAKESRTFRVEQTTS